MVTKVISGTALEIKLKGRETTVFLLGIMSPRLGNRSKANEPFAWQSREFLRPRIIGKKVEVTTIKKNNRTFVRVWDQRVEVGPEMVKRGWAKVVGTSGLPEDYRDLLEDSQDIAKSKAVGMWTRDPALISQATSEVEHSPDLDALLRKKKFKAVVESVFDGSTLGVTLLPSLQYLKVGLAGVQSPRFETQERVIKEDIVEEDIVATPYAKEALEFTKSRLLHRTVDIMLLGRKSPTVLFGQVLSSGRNIAIFLLKAGFATVDEWTIQKTPGVEVIRKAEREAKASGKRLFVDLVEEEDAAVHYDGRIVGLLNTDTVRVLDSEGVHHSVRFAHLRCPYFNKEFPAPHTFEAREFVRKRVIGKKCSVTVLGQKETTEQGDVLVEGVNIAIQIIERGWAHVLKSGLTRPSLNFHDYIRLQNEASVKKIGLFHPRPPQPMKWNDISRANDRKLREYLQFIPNPSNALGIVEYVISPSKMVVLLPSEKAIVTIGLSEIVSPKREDDISDKARDFLSDTCLSRSIVIEFVDVSRGGFYLARVLIEGVDLAEEMVKHGMLKVHAGAAKRSGHGRRLLEIEAEAKQNKIGLWRDSVNEQNEQVVPKRFRGKITDVLFGGRFFLQRLDDQMEHILRYIASQGSKKEVQTLTRGARVLAKSPDTKKVYRARIDAVNERRQEVRLTYIDYGNIETVPFTSLYLLEDADIRSIPPQARESNLALLWSPKLDSQYGVEAAEAFSEMAHGSTFDCELVTTSGGVDGVILLNSEGISLNEAYVDEGYARLHKIGVAGYEEYMKTIKQIEESALASRVGIFEYGDAFSPED